MVNGTSARVSNAKKWLTNPSLEMVKAQTAIPQGNRHNPIRHVDALSIFHDTLANSELGVKGNFSMMSKDGMKYLFIVDIHSAESDFTWTFGFVNSNDRSKAFTILLGEKVFICSNMMFGGQLDDLKRRHCGDIYSEVSDRCELGLERFKTFTDTRTLQIDMLKDRELTEGNTGELILGMHRSQVIGNANINRIVNEFDTPSFDCFKDRTAWNFQNACTEVFKGIDNPIQRLDSQKHVNRLFNDVLDIPVID